MSFAFQGIGNAFQRTGFAFQQELGTVYPPPAGRKRRRKLEVEIDGQVFEVESLDHAQALLDRAKAIALSKAAEIVEPIVEKRMASMPPKGRPIRVPAPQISTHSDELVSMVVRFRHEIAKIYRQAALDAEIRLRLQLQEIDDDDETILLLL